MKTKFKLVGLSMPKRFTLETESEKLFWINESHLSNLQYSQLFDLAKNTDYIWSGENYCIVEHDGYFADGETPKRPFIKEIFLSL